MSSGYVLPVCQTHDGNCHPSTVKLCDLEPPQFPSWFSTEQKEFLTQNCDSWKLYQKYCKGSDYPPWWVAVIVVVLLAIIVISIIILYKKKKLKWVSRVSDAKLSPKQMCCKGTSQNSVGHTDRQKVKAMSQNTNGTFENDEGVNECPPESEPYYYVLEPQNTVTLSRTVPHSGTFGKGVMPPSSGSIKLPPLDSLNNNGMRHGKTAVFSVADSKMEVVEPSSGSSRRKRRKQKKGKQMKPKAQQPEKPNIDDKYMYGE